MRKKVFIAYAILLVLGGTFASTRTADAITTDELRAQIEALLAQVKQLQTQLAQLEGGSAQWCYTFNTNLRFGDRNSEVNSLYQAFVKEGGLIRGTRNPNDFEFDEAIASAVVGFQEKYRSEILTPNGLQFGTGFVGPSTRAKLNVLYGCGGIRPIPIPIPMPVPPAPSSITVLSPNGGEKWAMESKQVIRWNTAIAPVDAKVAVHLSGVDGHIVAGIPVQDASTTITVPKTTCGIGFDICLPLKPADNFKVKLELYTGENYCSHLCPSNTTQPRRLASDESNNFFSIVASSTQP